MGEDDPVPIRRRLPVAVPALDQIVPSLLTRLRLMHHVVGAVSLKRMACFASGEITCGVPLPVLALAAHLADFRAAMALMDRAEGCARLDCLQLLRISDQYDLGADFCGMGQHAL